MTNRKIIKKLPTGWPLKGFSRADHGEYIVLIHPERTPVKSLDGVNWSEVTLYNREDNRMMFMIEKDKISKR